MRTISEIIIPVIIIIIVIVVSGYFIKRAYYLSKMSDLKENQYKDSGNFSARIYLFRKFSSNKDPWAAWVFDNFRAENKNAKVLELGCGTGMLWKANAKRIPAGWEITLSDFSEGMLKDAEKNIGNKTGNIKYEVINAESIPHKDNTFDIIVANHMLYHVPDRRKALSEIHRVLKKGGIFYSTTASMNSMKEIRQIIHEYNTGISYSDSSSALFSNFSLENGRDQLKEFFGDITLKKYDNELLVNEAKPFVDYVISCNNIHEGKTVLNESMRDSFTKFVQDKIDKNNNIKVSSEFGMFISRKTK